MSRFSLEHNDLRIKNLSFIVGEVMAIYLRFL
jgi:hypothetical protein